MYVFPPATADELLALLARLPENEYIEIRVQPNTDGFIHEPEGMYLHAYHMIDPPEDGWPNRAAYFRHPVQDDEIDEDFKYRDDPSVLYGVSVSVDDPANFIPWLVRDLRARLEKLGR